ncbi:MAG TPA: TetR family transcriptional regulator [Microlunatus sp.]
MAEPALADFPISARRARTRDRLLTAAVAVFAERGVNGASVEEICDAASFTRGAFYSNFADKSDLVLALLDRSMTVQFSAAQQAVADMKAATDASAEEMITLALTAFERAGRPFREGILLDQELRLHAAREPALHAAYLNFVHECDRQMAALIVDALAHLGLELTVPFEHALRLLAAVHDHEQRLAVFEGQPADATVMRSLLLAITRPAPEK